MAFSGALLGGGALFYAPPAQIDILEAGYYSISWQVFSQGYDVAFGLFFAPGASAAFMVPGSNYAAMAHDETCSGQTVAYLPAGGSLTLNRIDNLHTQVLLQQISLGTFVTGASIVMIKIG